MDGRTMRSRDYIREDWSEKVGKMFVDVDHMYSANVNDVQTKDREIAKLKELHLKHLDMIQQQSEVIHMREKENIMLQKENDTLRSRLQRMERRVTLQRHKDDPTAPEESPTPSTSETLVEAPTVPTSTTTSQPLELPLKRRRPSVISALGRKRRTISGCSSGRKRSISASDSNDVVRRSCVRVPLTDTSYYTVAGDIEIGPLDLTAPPEPDPTLLSEAQVQVPSWREKVFSPFYVIEGTENLDDEVFLKRHQKLEIDERRRKRWDIQRLRDQMQVEKLKQRRLKGTKPAASVLSDAVLTSFFPSADDVQEITVESKIPVFAFGVMLRNHEPSEFSLSWNSQPVGSKYLSLRHR